MEFFEYPKMARWSRDIVITEKIDGTNGQILIEPYNKNKCVDSPPMGTVFDVNGVSYDVWVGSRNRWIYPGGTRDNAGFAGWVGDNLKEITSLLGEGRHFGEWWGPGIQRGYGMKEKTFSLFNVTRWRELPVYGGLVNRVPILYEGPNEGNIVERCMETLGDQGSYASPGFMRPEGIVWWHTAGNVGFKKTFESDEKGKGQ